MAGGRRILAALLAAAAAIAATACGGATRLSFPFAKIEIDAPPDLRLAARREWARAGATDAADAEWNLSLAETLEESIDERDNDGAVDAYLLRYRLTYNLRAGGRAPLAAGILESETVVDYSPSRHHAYRREKERTLRDLRRESMARLLSLADEAARTRRGGE